MKQDKLESFEQLVAWQKAQHVAVLAYKLSGHFPDSEKFGLTNQLRRAAASVSANIAEGFGRVGSKDKAHFYTIAFGSLLETKNFIYLAVKLDYLEEPNTKQLIDNIVECQKLISGLIKAVKS